jgi:hypothetical protein
MADEHGFRLTVTHAIKRGEPYHESVWGMSHSVQRGGRGIIR